MNPKFPLGQIVATPNALDSLAPEDIQCGIQRHQTGNWGDVCDSDRQENDLSLEKGFRLLSVYRASNGKLFWIITGANRSSTTVLMPEDY
jgi:hypothetical protein